LEIEVTKRFMVSKTVIMVFLAGLMLLATSTWLFVNQSRSRSQEVVLAAVTRRDLKVTVSTNGTIEPIDGSEIFAPIDAFIAHLQVHEGDEVAKGQLLLRLESSQLKTALAEARAALLQARRQAQLVINGPSKEELTAVQASITETELEVQQRREDLKREEALLKQDATTRVNVENVQERLKLLEVRLEGLKQKKQDLLNRFTAEEREWELRRINELTEQVRLLEQQLESATIFAPFRGVVYSLPLKSGAFVSKGQVLARIFVPGRVRLRALVDEPELARIEKGQETLIEWDGLPEKRWTGQVERLAEGVVILGNRSVGHVICSVGADASELIPNINVNVQITIARKMGALVVPRSAVFNHNSQPSVTVLEGSQKVLKPVTLGLVTPQEIEILQGLQEGGKVVMNPEESSH
jgi:HlyD family secretion protein